MPPVPVCHQHLCRLVLPALGNRRRTVGRSGCLASISGSQARRSFRTPYIQLSGPSYCHRSYLTLFRRGGPHLLHVTNGCQTGLWTVLRLYRVAELLSLLHVSSPSRKLPKFQPMRTFLSEVLQPQQYPDLDGIQAARLGYRVSPDAVNLFSMSRHRVAVIDSHGQRTSGPYFSPLLRAYAVKHSTTPILQTSSPRLQGLQVQSHVVCGRRLGRLHGSIPSASNSP